MSCIHNHITLLALLAVLPALGQTGNSNLLYDIGIMIQDSNKTTVLESGDSLTAPVLNQEQAALEEELNSYQQKLAETEIRLRFQTRIIDSLQTEISQIKAANETDRALLTSKITKLVDEQDQVGQHPLVTAGTVNVSDSVFAELHTPWGQITLQHPLDNGIPTTPKLSPAEEQAAYRRGLTKFHQQFYYQAIDEFNTIVYRGTDRTMLANAQYWVGSCYYEKGLYDEAIAALEKVQQYEQSDKLDDALVMIGLAFKNKHRLPEAKLAFQELVSRHPGSEYLTLAKRFVQE